MQIETNPQRRDGQTSSGDYSSAHVQPAGNNYGESSIDKKNEGASWSSSLLSSLWNWLRVSKDEGSKSKDLVSFIDSSDTSIAWWWQ